MFDSRESNSSKKYKPINALHSRIDSTFQNKRIVVILAIISISIFIITVILTCNNFSKQFTNINDVATEISSVKSYTFKTTETYQLTHPHLSRYIDRITAIRSHLPNSSKWEYEKGVKLSIDKACNSPFKQRLAEYILFHKWSLSKCAKENRCSLSEFSQSYVEENTDDSDDAFECIVWSEYEERYKDVFKPRFMIQHVGGYGNHGMGNRFAVLLSAFIYSLLSRRALLIDWKHTEACVTGCQTKLTNDQFDIFEFFELPQIDLRVDTLTQIWSMSELIESSKVLNIDQWQEAIPAYEHLMCDNYDSVNERVVWIHGNQFFHTHIYQNDFYRSIIEKEWELTLGSLTPLILHFLLKPRSSIQSLIDSHLNKLIPSYNEKLNSNDSPYLIGIQLRGTEHIGTDNYKKAHLFCAETVKATLPLTIRENTKIILVTDSQQMVEYSKSRYNDISVFDCGISNQKATANDYSYRGIKCAMASMFLLSQVDDLIMSKESSFGDVAHAHSGLRQMVTTKQAQCWRSSTADPCSHYFKYLPLKIRISNSQCRNDARRILSHEQLQGWCASADMNEVSAFD